MASDEHGSLYVDPGDTVPDLDIQESNIPPQNLRTFTAVLLAFLIIVAFLGNLFLLGTIVSSSKLRNFKFHLFMVNVAVVNLLDIVMNMFVSLMYVAFGKWPFNSILCNINAAGVELCGIMSLAGVMLMAIDRAVAMLDAQRYKHRMSATRTSVLIFGLWLIAFFLYSPIAIGSVSSKPFEYRHFCAVKPLSPIGYTIVLLIIYALCLTVILAAFGVILYRANQRQSSLPLKPSDYTAFIQESRAFQDQLDMGKLTLVVYIVCFLLQGPYLFLNLGLQIRNSKELVNSYDGVQYLAGEEETLITLLKFVYPVVFPFIAFGFCQSIMEKFTKFVCCRRTNAVSMSTSTHDLQNQMSGKRLLRKDSGSDHDNNVMTLVATQDGLHLHSGNQTGDFELHEVHEGNQHPNKLNKHPNNWPNNNRKRDAQTSDYDSEDSCAWDIVQNWEVNSPPSSEKTATSCGHVQLLDQLNQTEKMRYSRHRRTNSAPEKDSKLPNSKQVPHAPLLKSKSKPVLNSGNSSADRFVPKKSPNKSVRKRHKSNNGDPGNAGRVKNGNNRNHHVKNANRNHDRKTQRRQK